MNIIKKLIYKKKDEDIEELKLKLLEAHGSYSRLKNKESSLMRAKNKSFKLQCELFELIDILKKDLSDTKKEMARRLELCKLEQCGGSLRLEKEKEKLREVNVQLGKELKPQYKILHKKHKQETDDLEEMIEILKNDSLRNRVYRKEQDGIISNLRIDSSLLASYKKDLNRALKVEVHYHDLVAENKKLKREIRELKE